LVGLNRDQPALYKEEAIAKIATISSAEKSKHISSGASAENPKSNSEFVRVDIILLIELIKI